MARSKKVKSVKRSGREVSTKQQRERYWRKIMRQWEQSGQTQAEYCRRQSLSLAAFGWWRSELKRRERERSGRADQQPKHSRKTDRQPKPVSFVPVEVALPSLDNPNGAPLEVVLRGDRRIRVGAQFDAAALEQLVAVLERVPC